MKNTNEVKPQLKVYAKLAVERYRLMSKKEKSRYLAALAADCQVSRQHARRVMQELLSGKSQVSKNKRGRKPIYKEDAVVWWLQSLWVDLNYSDAYPKKWTIG